VTRQTLTDYIRALREFLHENGVNVNDEGDGEYFFIEGPQLTTHVVRGLVLDDDAHFSVVNLVDRIMGDVIPFSDPDSFDLCLKAVR
jgi:hypothetical protein